VSSGRTISFIIFSIASTTCGAAITLGAGAVYGCILFGFLLYMFLVGGHFENALSTTMKVGDDTFEKGGAQAEETLSAIKVVK